MKNTIGALALALSTGAQAQLIANEQFIDSKERTAAVVTDGLLLTGSNQGGDQFRPYEVSNGPFAPFHLGDFSTGMTKDPITGDITIAYDSSFLIIGQPQVREAPIDDITGVASFNGDRYFVSNNDVTLFNEDNLVEREFELDVNLGDLYAHDNNGEVIFLGVDRNIGKIYQFDSGFNMLRSDDMGGLFNRGGEGISYDNGSLFVTNRFGVGRFDGFTIVPPPATGALLGLAGVVAGSRRKLHK